MRFPDVTWYCDVCGDCLSDQEDFDDEVEWWTCTKCGAISKISYEGIIDDEEEEEDFELDEDNCEPYLDPDDD